MDDESDKVNQLLQALHKANADLDRLEEAYTRLSMLHSETMIHLIDTQQRSERLSKNWVSQMIYWFQLKFGWRKWYD